MSAKSDENAKVNQYKLASQENTAAILSSSSSSFSLQRVVDRLIAPELFAIETIRSENTKVNRYKLVRESRAVTRSRHENAKVNRYKLVRESRAVTKIASNPKHLLRMGMGYGKHAELQMWQNVC